MNSQKTVLMIAPIYPPHAGAGIHRTLRFSKYLSELGVNVIVITMGAFADEDTDDQMSKSNRVEVVRIGPETNLPGSGPATNRSNTDITLRSGVVSIVKNCFRPFWQLLTLTPDRHWAWSKKAAANAIEICTRRKIDSIYSTGPPHSVHLAGRRVARATGIPLVADFRDPWARNSWIRKRNPIGRKLNPLFEKMVVSTASCVIANNEGSLASFEETYPDEAKNGKFVSITNGFDPERLSQQKKLPEGSATENSTITVLHAGSLYAQRNPRTLVQAIVSMISSGVDIRFRQIGHCEGNLDPVSVANSLGKPEAVERIDQMSHSSTMHYIMSADILVLIQPNAPFQVPGKLFEMLLFGQPIVAICESAPTEKIVSEAGGVCASSLDPVAIEQALRTAIEMRGNPELRLRREAARHKYNGRNLTKSLAAVFDRVTSQGSGS